MISLNFEKAIDFQNMAKKCWKKIVTNRTSILISLKSGFYEQIK